MRKPMNQGLRGLLLAMMFVGALPIARGGLSSISPVRPDPADGRLHILAIGVDRYDFATFKMSGKDAGDLAAAFERGAKGLFKGVKVHLLLGEAPTEAGIEDAFEALVRSVRPEDSVLVFFAGLATVVRGDVEGDDLHLLPADARPSKEVTGFVVDSREMLGPHTISRAQLVTWFSRMQARWQVLVFDTFTTTSALDRLVRELVSREAEIKDLLQRSRLVVGTEGPTSEVDAIGNGLVTAAVLSALGGGGDLGPEPDGVLTAWEAEASLPLLFHRIKARHDLERTPTRLRARAAGDDFRLAVVSGAEGGESRGLGSERSRGATEEPPREAPRRDYALLFATDTYDEPQWKPLQNPVNDARTLAKELSDRYGFETQVVENATYRTTYETLKEWQEKTYGPKDQLLVFFAGHGHYNEVTREGYVISRDSGSAPAFNNTFRHSELRSAIDAFPCRHILVVMDTCFGGTFDQRIGESSHRGSGIYDDVGPEKLIERLLGYKARLYLTSGGKEYVPDGRPGHHSPFAFKLLEALRGKAGRRGLVTWTDIANHVRTLPVEPRAGEFGSPDPGADFVFVLRE